MTRPEPSQVVARRSPLALAAILIPLYAPGRPAALAASWAGRLAGLASQASLDGPWVLALEGELPESSRPASPRPRQLPPPGDEPGGPPGWRPDPLTPRRVEEALRRLDDYTYLAGHPLARWQVVQRRLPATSRTSLDRGKAVYDVLAEAIEKLRPAGKLPADPPPRVWHPYLILHGAYLANTPNRDVMCRLYVSEGTFNRARRRAVQAVTRWLEESEAALAA